MKEINNLPESPVRESGLTHVLHTILQAISDTFRDVKSFREEQKKKHLQPRKKTHFKKITTIHKNHTHTF